MTARTKDLEQHFPEQKVEYHLEKLGLKEFFWPDRVIYTDAGPKYEILQDLGVETHYDDSIEEHFDDVITIRLPGLYSKNLTKNLKK